MSNSAEQEKQIKKLSPVGQYLKEKYIHRGEGGMTQQELADKLGVTRQTVNLIAMGRRPLSPTLAMKLSEVFGETIEFWLSLKKTKDKKGNVLDNAVSELAQAFFNQLEEMGPHTLVDYEIENAVECGVIGIENYSENLVQPLSYDMRAGDAIVSSEKGEILIDLTKNRLNIKPMCTVVVRTHEILAFPKNFFGRLGITTELSSHGIFVTHGPLVDPGFEGPLHVAIFNPTAILYTMECLQPFLTLEINYLAKQSRTKYAGRNQNRMEYLPEEKEIVKRNKNLLYGNDKSIPPEVLQAAITIMRSTFENDLE